MWLSNLECVWSQAENWPYSHVLPPPLNAVEAPIKIKITIPRIYEVAFSRGFFSLTLFIFFYALRGGQGLEPGNSALQISSSSFKLLGRPSFHRTSFICSFIHLYCSPGFTEHLLCTGPCDKSLGGAVQPVKLFSNSSSPPGSYRIMFVHRLWNNFRRFSGKQIMTFFKAQHCL